jgi:predicted permease
MRPHGIRRLFRFPSRSRDDIRQDVGDEFAFHLDMRTRDLIESGLDERAARAQALREFGSVTRGTAANVAQGVELERQRRLVRFFSELIQDARYGLRLYARSPGFAAAAILTLTVAIGGNTAVFSIVNGLFFKPLAIPDPDRLVRIYPGQNGVSWPNYEDIRSRGTVFEQVMAQRNIAPAFSTGGDPVDITGTATSSNYFELLGAAPLRGRVYLAGELRPNVVVISERLWRSRLDAAEDVVGRTVTIDGRTHEIIGVMPRSFRGVAPPGFVRDVWIPTGPPFGNDPRFASRDSTAFEVYARLRPGVGVDEAQAATLVVGRHLKDEHPRVNDHFDRMEVFPMSGLGSFRGIARALLPVFMFLGLMTVIGTAVLLVGCANLAGLLLGRAAARRREIAVRLGLGAGRRRLIRQLLTESLLLAIAGGGLGIVLAVWITSALPALTSRLPFPIEIDVALDRRVLFYALMLSLLTVICSGLAPARRAACFDLVASLKDEAGATGRQRLRHALVIGQVAACSALLVLAGLFARSLANVTRIDPGFDPTDVLMVDLERVGPADDQDGMDRARVALQDRVREMPGVQAAGMISNVPLALMGREEFPVRLGANTERGPRVMANNVTPGYFEAVRIPLLEGRDFTWQDRRGAPAVVILNHTAARQFFNGAAVGRRLSIPGRTEWIEVEVVGVVADSKYWTLGETIAPAMYAPALQRRGGANLAVRTSTPADTAGTIRTELQRIAPAQPIRITLMTDAISVAAMPARVGAFATSSFGIVAVLLAALGIYGLVAFTVAQRTREIGIRKAIGARTSDVVRAVVGGSVIRVAIGLATGAVLGSLAATLLGGILANVSPFDPLTLIGVCAIVAVATIAATVVPTLRALRVDPVVSMRVE